MEEQGGQPSAVELQAMADKTAKTQGYCDRMRGQHLNPFAFDLWPQEFRDWIAGYNDARAFEEMFAVEMDDGSG